MTRARQCIGPMRSRRKREQPCRRLVASLPPPPPRRILPTHTSRALSIGSSSTRDRAHLQLVWLRRRLVHAAAVCARQGHCGARQPSQPIRAFDERKRTDLTVNSIAPHTSATQRDTKVRKEDTDATTRSVRAVVVPLTRVLWWLDSLVSHDAIVRLLGVVQSTHRIRRIHTTLVRRIIAVHFTRLIDTL
jgi:hypothetical protein